MTIQFRDTFNKESFMIIGICGLIGSGKGVASVKEIKKIGWKRKNLTQYKRFSKYYRSAIKQCLMYKF